MSELVRKVHTLTRDLLDRDQLIADWRTLYASEVNHSEEMAKLLSLMHLPCSRPLCSFCIVLKEHEERRQADLDRNPNSPLGDKNHNVVDGDS